MTGVLDPQLKRALAERVRYYNELGIYDFYRREPVLADPGTTQNTEHYDNPSIQPEQRDLMTPRSKAAIAIPVEENISKWRSRKLNQAWPIPSRRFV